MDQRPLRASLASCGVETVGSAIDIGRNPIDRRVLRPKIVDARGWRRSLPEGDKGSRRLSLATMTGYVLFKGQSRLLGFHASLVTNPLKSVVLGLRGCSRPSTQISDRFREF
jgi:hypothetical protein